MIAWPSSVSTHFDQAVRAYSAELFQYASWMCRDRHRAEDILQDAFTRAWRNWGQVTDESARRAWLYVIVRNEFLRDTGRLKGRPEELSDDHDAPTLDIVDETDFTFGVEIRDVLQQLPAHYLEPLLLQNLVGMSCEEIAEVIGLSVGATMTRLSRARLAIRALLDGAASIPSETNDRPALRLVANGGKK